MRDSRIKHPLGGRLLLLRFWAVDSLGFAPAAVLGLLDWLDRSQESAGEPLASRTRIVAALEGIVGRNAVDHALDQLCEQHLVVKVEQREWGGRNYQTRHVYSLDVDAINAYLDSRYPGIGTPGIPVPERQASPSWSPIRDVTIERDKEKTTTTIVCCFSVGDQEVSVELTSAEANDAWAEALEAAVVEADRVKTISAQKYALGILRNWRQQRVVDRTPLLTKQRREKETAIAENRREQTKEQLEAEIRRDLADGGLKAAGERFLARRGRRRPQSDSAT